MARTKVYINDHCNDGKDHPETHRDRNNDISNMRKDTKRKRKSDDRKKRSRSERDYSSDSSTSKGSYDYHIKDHSNDRKDHTESRRDRNNDRRNSRKERKRKRKSDDRKKRSRSKRDYSSDSSTSKGSYDDRRHKKKKKKRKKDKKKKSDVRSCSSHDKVQRNPDKLRRNHLFVESLHDLFDGYPALSSDLPYMLIRMAGGTSFDLSQMPDSGAALGLKCVFENLEVFGVHCSNNSCSWGAPENSMSRNNELLLIKIARTLMDEIGITMKAVERYEKSKIEEDTHTLKEHHKEIPKNTESLLNPLQIQMHSLLDRFIQKDSSISQQMAELCKLIISGESVAIDDLPDDNLRQGLESIFRRAGLEYSEMVNDSEENGEDDTEMGYGLPEKNSEFPHANMQSLLDACNDKAASTKAASTKAASRRPLKGPLPQHMADAYPTEKDDESDDDEGPLPMNVTNCRTAASAEVVNALSEKRKDELKRLNPNNHELNSSEREEWMINPGEHDLLKGIRSGTMKNRSFENKKVRMTSDTQEPAAPVHPSVQAEIDSIIEATAAARGPSLMEQHRINKTAEKASKTHENSSKSYNWNREKDLDSGRRVDTENLRQLMGGARGDLKDKFQGGFAKT